MREAGYLAKKSPENTFHYELVPSHIVSYLSLFLLMYPVSSSQGFSPSLGSTII